jgi:integrase
MGNLRKRERPSRDDAKPQRVLEREELDAVLAHASPHFALAIKLAAFTGLRPGEICGLQWRDLDLAKGELHVERQMDQYGKLSPPKHNSKRTVILFPDLAKALREHKLASPRSQPDDPIFLNTHGTAMRYFTFKTQVKKAVRDAGIDQRHGQIDPHSLRRGFASILIAQGCNPVFVQRQLGHKNPGVTWQAYAKAFDEARSAEQAKADLETAFATVN